MTTPKPKIEKLIDELCPQGVEFRALGEVFNIKNGYTPSKMKSEYWTNGTIPWFRMEDIRKNGRVLNDSIQHITLEAVKSGKLFPANSIIMATTATIGEHALITVDSLANQQFTFLSKKLNCPVDMKFFFYYSYVLAEWCKNNTNSASFASVSMNGFKKFKIPIPPLTIQKEIVKILDNFTQLEAELEAELEARKKQYEYYREQLLMVNDEGLMVDGTKVEFRALGKVANIKNGKDWKVLSSGDVPVYGTGGIMGYVDKFSYNQPTVLIPRKGSIENIFYLEEPFWNIDTIYYTEINIKIITPKYFYYFLETLDLKKLDTGSGRPSLTRTILNKIKIPIPPLAKQQEIVAILDKFDALVNDISTGLPAEIVARKKQYEYYRNQLLNFKPLDAQNAN